MIFVAGAAGAADKKKKQSKPASQSAPAKTPAARPATSAPARTPAASSKPATTGKRKVPTPASNPRPVASARSRPAPAKPAPVVQQRRTESPKPQPAVAPAPRPPARQERPSLLVSTGPTIGGCPAFPADNPYNTDIYDAPVDRHSDQYMRHMGGEWMRLHPDFGPSDIGKPITVVDGSQPWVPIHFEYAADSDPGPYPLPLDVLIQAGPGGDRHAIVVDQGNCKLYETFATYRSGNGFRAGSGAVFDLRSNALRPEGWTSATASGLPIAAGVARYEEVAEEGILRHALSFGATSTAHSYVHPATHSSGNSRARWAPPLGTRVRLKRDFDLSGFRGQSLVILKGMQHYGMFLVDNQDDNFWSVGGARDSRWDNGDLQQLKRVPASAFEVIEMPDVHEGP